MKKKQVSPPKKKSNSLKRFGNTLTFLILLGCGGYVFYRGWIQFSIPENHYALAFTKTGGYDKALMSAGDFHWRWENVFPTNMTLHIFELPWNKTELEIDGVLPSGREYASILPEGETFRFSIGLVFQFRLNPENIGPFIGEASFQYADISQWYETIPLQAESIAREILLSRFHQAAAVELPSLEQEIEESILREIPEAEIKELNILHWEIPDPALYETARAMYLESIRENRAYASALEKETAEVQSRLSGKIDLLRDYGEVLTEYPVLLEYFNLEKEKIDPMIFNWEESRNPDPEP